MAYNRDSQSDDREEYLTVELREGMAGENPPKLWREGALERGEEMPRRTPAVTGSECVSARYEFRWNHGQFCSP